MKNVFYLFFLLTGLFSCTEDNIATEQSETPILPSTSYHYSDLKLPMNTFAPGENIFGNDVIFPDKPNFNAVTFVNDDVATLGRVLFYDKKLSANNTISCGSCHLQSKAFADGQQFSTGFEGRVTTRNSMAIVNPILQRNLFWDSRSFSIEDLSLKPVQNHIEMGMEDLTFLAEKLSKVEYYPDLFKKAFGANTIISEQKISEAISNFIASITTADSKFDEGLNTGFANYTEIESLGRQVFFSERAKCSSCHAGNNFSAQDGPNDPYGGGGDGSGAGNLKGTTNIGLDFVAADQGREKGMFRIPSLRNIAVTAPYMHDGRFKTLEEVIDHYRFGIKPSESLDVKFKDGQGHVKPLDISETEKFALVAFLNTLTDKSMMTDPKYSDPIKK